MHKTRLGITLATFALVVAACSSGGVGSEDRTTTPADGGGGTSLTLVGENISFDTTTLTAPAGQEVTITFENRDGGIRHNLQIIGPSGPIATDIEAGPVTQTLNFTIDEPGTYTFLCQVHPIAMVGDLVIEG